MTPQNKPVLIVKVTEDKALFHEIKKLNKAGRPQMRIHEPRIRLNTGDILKLHPEEIQADGNATYYRSFDQSDLYIRKKDITPVDLAGSESQTGSESVTERPVEKAILIVEVTEDKALLHEIKKLNKAGRPQMRIHEPRIRFNNGDTIKLHPEEIQTDGKAIYYRSFDQSDLYVRKKDITPVDLAGSESQTGSESVTEQPVEKAFLIVEVTEDKALFHEIKKLNKAGRPLMRIHEPRIRFNNGDTIKLHPEEIQTDGKTIFFRSFDQSDLYVRKKDVTPVK